MQRAKLKRLSKAEVLEQLREDARAACRVLGEFSPPEDDAGKAAVFAALIRFGKSIDRAIRAGVFKDI